MSSWSWNVVCTVRIMLRGILEVRVMVQEKEFERLKELVELQGEHIQFLEHRVEELEGD